MSAIVSRRTSLLTASTDCVIRTAPVRRLPSTIGTAVNRRSWPSEALWRSPCLTLPASACWISGRSAYEADARPEPAESASSRPWRRR